MNDSSLMPRVVLILCLLPANLQLDPEDKAEGFRYDGRKLVYQAALPKRATVIPVPKELFEETRELAR